MRRTLVIAWLGVLWVLLWRDPSPSNLAVGLVLATVVERAFRSAATPARHRIRPVGAARFALHFGRKLLEANVVVAREVIAPQSGIETGIVAVPMSGCSDFVVTVVTNAVSLTPGTLTVEVRGGDPPTLYVHVLLLHDIEQARDDVRTLTRLASDAFPASPSTPEATGTAA